MSEKEIRIQRVNETTREYNTSIVCLEDDGKVTIQMKGSTLDVLMMLTRTVVQTSKMTDLSVERILAVIQQGQDVVKEEHNENTN